MDLTDLQDRLKELKSIDKEMKSASLELNKLRDKQMSEIREKIRAIKTKQKPNGKTN